MLLYAGILGYHGSHSIFNPCLVGSILGSQWEAGVRRDVIQLEFESAEM